MYRYSYCLLILFVMISGCQEDTTQIEFTPPAVVTDLRAIESNDHAIHIAWTIPDGGSSADGAQRAEIRYASTSEYVPTWSELPISETRNIHGSAGAEQAVWINGLDPNNEYIFAVRCESNPGNWSKVSNFLVAKTTCGVEVVLPGHGEAVCDGDTLFVSWLEQECHSESMNIELLHDGVLCRYLGQGYEGNYSWACQPYENFTTNYQIRITDRNTNNVGLTPMFDITPDCVVDLYFPSGGEYFCEGLPVDINWQRSSCCGEYVKISLLHNGSVVDTIVEQTNNDRYHRWIVQPWQYFTYGYAIKIEDLVTGATSISNSTFSINEPRPPEVTSPNGGERFYDDQEIEITWMPDECRTGTVSIELWQNDAYCSRIDRNTANDGHYLWTVKSCSSDSTNYQVRIVDGDFEDISDSYFVIARECQIDVLYPDGGEILCEDETMEILWDSTRWCGNSVRIDIQQDNNICYNLTLETQNDGHFEWVAQQCNSVYYNYKIVIQDLTTGMVGVSEGPFVIRDRCYMTVTRPLAGAVLYQDVGTYIDWDRSNCCPSSETILLLQHGVVCDTLVHHNPTQTQAWWRANSCSSDPDGYSIRIQSQDANYWTESQGTFSILQGCWVKIEPLGYGTPEFCADTIVSLQWTSSSDCGENVRIELQQNGQLCQVLSDSAPNNGLYQWRAEQYQANQNGYQFKVTDIDNNFSTVSPGTFSVLGPVFNLRPDGLGDATTLKHALELACSGDTILLANGTYTGVDNIAVTINHDITVRSQSGDPTLCIFDAQSTSGGFTLQNGAIEGVTFTGYTTTPIEVIGHITPVIRNCIFKNNVTNIGGGIWCRRLSNPIVENCLFTMNTANRGGAVGGQLSSGTFVNCTFYRNSAAIGSAISAYSGTNFVFRNCIFTTHNGGEWIHCQYSSTVSIECCNSYANGNNFPECVAAYSGIDGNFSEHPQFCNVGQDDFRLQVNSPCLPAGNSCGELIGAYGQCVDRD